MSDTEEKPVADVEADEVEETPEEPAAEVPKEPLTINEGVQVGCTPVPSPSSLRMLVQQICSAWRLAGGGSKHASCELWNNCSNHKSRSPQMLHRRIHLCRSATLLCGSRISHRWLSTYFSFESQCWRSRRLTMALRVSRRMRASLHCFQLCAISYGRTRSSLTAPCNSKC